MVIEISSIPSKIPSQIHALHRRIVLHSNWIPSWKRWTFICSVYYWIPNVRLVRSVRCACSTIRLLLAANSMKYAKWINKSHSIARNNLLPLRVMWKDYELCSCYTNELWMCTCRNFFVLRKDVKHSTFHLAMNHPHKLFMLISLSLVNKLDEGYDWHKVNEPMTKLITIYLFHFCCGYVHLLNQT